VSPALFADTPLADLANTLGWFAVSTPLEAGGTLRSVVYVDGDVTTKLIGARTLTDRDATTHFATIDRQAGLVRARLRTIVLTLVTTWCAVAVALVAALRDLASLAGAVAILVPLGVVMVQRWLRRSLTASTPVVAALGAAVAIGAGIVFDVHQLVAPAAVALALNLALVVGFAILRARLRKLLGSST
jgi:hypothetical protein